MKEDDATVVEIPTPATVSVPPGLVMVGDSENAGSTPVVKVTYNCSDEIRVVGEEGDVEVGTTATTVILVSSVCKFKTAREGKA
jgi:hypothetical protein